MCMLPCVQRQSLTMITREYSRLVDAQLPFISLHLSGEHLGRSTDDYMMKVHRIYKSESIPCAPKSF